MIARKSFVLAISGVVLSTQVFAQPDPAEPPTRPSSTVERPEPVDAEASEQALLERDRLTGDWGGYRTRLEERGIDINFGVWADLFQNVRGGANTADMDFMHLESLNLTLDTQKLFELQGGTFFIDLQHIGGDNPSDNVGDWQWVSSIASDRRDEIAELWYEQKLMDDQVRLKLGKIEPCYEFDVSEIGAMFLNSSSGQSPTIPGFPTYPDSAFGFIGDYAPSEILYLRAGVFDGNQQEGKTLGDDGPRTVFKGPSDLFLIAEVGFGWNTESLPGRAAVGVSYHTGTFDRFDGGTDDGVLGYYAVLEQVLHKESDDPEDAQATRLFLRAGFTDADTYDVRYHLGGGVVATGLCPERDEDSIGVGVNFIGFSNAADADFAGDELNLELFYAAQVTPYLAITPDLQYVINPGGDESLDDALVLGVRFVLNF